MAKQERTNSVGLVQVEGGYRVKQGDVSSLFAYRLVDERGEPIALDGELAIVRLVKGEDYAIIYETTATVVGDLVSFTIAKPLPLGGCWVEIVAGGYVFPSDDKMKLLITRSATAYSPIDLAEKVQAGEGGAGFEHRQDSPSKLWQVSHTLGKYPSVTVIDTAGNKVYGHVQYVSKSLLTISFSAEFSGTAILN